MAKRKRSEQLENRKRARVEQEPKSSQHLHGEVDEDELYKIKDIIDEDRTRYHIRWEGHDPKTGKPWPDTWEPKLNANKPAVEAWKKQKAEQRDQAKQQSKKRAPSLSTSGAGTPTSAVKKPAPRNRRVIESSPPQSGSTRTNGHAALDLPDPDVEVLEIGESPVTSPAVGPQDPNSLFVPEEALPAAAVNLSAPPSSYFAGAYDKFSSQVQPSSSSLAANNDTSVIEPSQYQPDPADTSKTTEDTTEISLAPTTPSQLIQSVPADSIPRSTQVVPDTQVAPGSSSYIPSTTTKSSSAPEASRATVLSEEQTSAAVQTVQSNTETGERSPTQQQTADEPNQSSSAKADRPSLAEVDSPERSKEASPRSPTHLSQSQSLDGPAEAPSPRPNTEAATDEQPVIAGTLQAGLSDTVVQSSSPQGIEPLATDPGEESAAASNTRPSATQREGQTGHHIQDAVPTDFATRVEPETTEPRKRPNADGPAQDSRVVDLSSAAEEVASVPIDSNKPTLAQLQIFTQAEGSGEELSQSPERSQSVKSTSSNLPSRVGTPQVRVIDGRASIYTPRFELHTVNGRAELVHSTTEIESRTSPLAGELERQRTDLTGSGVQTSPFELPPRADRIEDSAVTSQHSIAAPVTAPIDLTTAATQDPTDSISNFTVTPPPRRQPLTNFLNKRSPPPPSTGLSAFPFETQPPRVTSTGTAPSPVERRRLEIHSQPVLVDHNQRSQLSAIAPLASSAPFGQSSPLHNFSPLPRAPSQSLAVATLGESVPQRPATPSSPTRSPSVARSMASSQGRYSSIKEWRQARRQNRREELDRANEASTSAALASSNVQQQSAVPPHVISENPPPTAPRLASPLLAQDGRRSPSAVPALEPRRASTLEEMNTSARYETLLPQSQDQENGARERNGSLTTMGTPSQRRSKDDLETRHVHAVPISLVGHQRDEYPQLIYHYRDTLQRFLATTSPDAGLLGEAEKFIDRARRIAMHPDLDNPETLTQYAGVARSRQADWDVRCSAKFRFLKKLLDCLQNKQVHVVIVAQPGRIIDILETFLQGVEVAYRRGDVSQYSTSEEMPDGNVTVTLLPVGGEQTLGADSPAIDLLVAMDNTATHDNSQVRALRHRDDKWAPMITLVVPCTVEHVERCLVPTLSDRARLRALASGINQFKGEAGKAEAGQLQPEDAAAAIAKFITEAEGDPEWPITTLSPLEDLGSQTESEIDPMVENGEGLAHVGDKRQREAGDDDDLSNGNLHKRLRGDAHIASSAEQLPTTINPQDVEKTHISDSVDNPTQSNLVESDHSSLSTTERRLQDLLITAQNQLEQHKRDLAERQFAFEEKRTELNEVKLERDQAILTATKAVERFNEQTNKISLLKGEKTLLFDQLGEANARLMDHSNPERAELEKVRLAALEMNAEKEKLEKRLAEANKQLEYTRGLYQDASNSAQQSALEISELTNQLSSTQNKATGEQAKLRQMGYDSIAKSLQDENKKLKVVVKNHEAALKLKDEEIAKLKEASRGRMGTRGTSVPRSPRMASPMKFDRRVGSRQGSPAAGELRGMLHPLRNA